MKYNPNIHHRRSIRLKGYDYTRPGAYFVTVCTQNRECLFGKIMNGEMKLNDAGRMIIKWRHELENKFPDIKINDFICMPNHIHFILINGVGADLRVCPVCPDNNATDAHNDLTNTPNDPTCKPDAPAKPNPSVRADLRVCPDNNATDAYDDPQVKPNPTCKPDAPAKPNPSVRADLRVCPVCPIKPDPMGEHDKKGEHAGSPLRRVVQWFKTMTTNEYIRGVKQHAWPPFPGKLWQRNYYERIIRNKTEFDKIQNYIVNNPFNWHDDKNYTGS